MALAQKKIWLILYLLFTTNLSFANSIPVKIVSCYDGDTCTASTNNKKVKVRIACIDAPELAQKHGEAARDFINSQIAGKDVSLSIITKGPYGRMIANIVTNRGNIGHTMINKGYAETYRGYTKYSKSLCFRHELLAKHFKRGIWSDKKYISPSIYRKSKK